MALGLGSAQAAPAPQLPAAQHDWPACPDGHPDRSLYPPRGCGLGLSKDHVHKGGHVSVFGGGFKPGELVTIHLHPDGGGQIGSTHADDNGDISTRVGVACSGISKGDKHIAAVGERSDNKLHSSIHVGRKAKHCMSGSTSSGGSVSGSNSSGGSVRSAPSTQVLGTSVTRSNESSSLPFTGSDAIIPMSAIGAALVLGGGMMLFLIRRRRATA